MATDLSLSSRRHIILAMAAISALMLMITMIAFAFVTGLMRSDGFTVELATSTPFNAKSIIVKNSKGHHRKLLLRDGPTETKIQPNRIWGDKCSKSDILINQGPTPPLPSGIPTYTVEIMNVCTTGCDISGIHLSCGWFSSARLINPRLFKRLGYNDCLLNDGKPLITGRTISFQYANTFPYPLSISSVVC